MFQPIHRHIFTGSPVRASDAPYLSDDLTHIVLSSLAALLCVDRSEPGRNYAGLVTQSVAEHVAVEVNRAALPLTDLI